ncbi:helix-turn-helix domain-containing protein [Poritiphilus flavus]|uniref:Response regulator n=1 Tax=Poritiphilus flavus TaxID=2697053 RepID=A0A6L9EJH0_9FLAO|nr:response regulator [Poritiphilus flavus]NAS14329.1 response regulator [Poritiphilus flavus]
MLKKVLVVEDLDSIGFGIAQMLKQQARIENVTQSLYCDDAYLKFLRSEKDNDLFDLLITDLSFKEDHRESKIKSGAELIQLLKERQPELKTIVYSVEDRSIKIKQLFEDKKIDGYVVKGRHGLRNLVEGISEIEKGNTYVSPELSGFMSQREVFEIEDYDLILLSHLSSGLTQEQIAVNFKQKGISPSSVSSIEKRLNRLKLEFKAKNAIHLVASAKDLGLI